jgi:hypothetical protein
MTQLPSVFLSHGAPTFAMEPYVFGRALDLAVEASHA